MDDWFEFAFYGFVVVALIIWGVMRLLHRGRVIEVRGVKSLGSYGGIDVELVSSSGGRRYLALRYEVKGRDGVREIEVLLNSANTRRLADCLEVALAPGRTVAHARLAAHRARQRKPAA